MGHGQQDTNARIPLGIEARLGPGASDAEIIIAVMETCAEDPTLDALEMITGIMEGRAKARRPCR